MFLSYEIYVQIVRICRRSSVWYHQKVFAERKFHMQYLSSEYSLLLERNSGKISEIIFMLKFSKIKFQIKFSSVYRAIFEKRSLRNFPT